MLGLGISLLLLCIMRFFRIYVGISLLIIMLLLGTLVGTIIYAGKKISNESAVVTTKVNSFNQNVNNINTNLNNISSQLKAENSTLEHNNVTLP
jgi:hypothetical protein